MKVVFAAGVQKYRDQFSPEENDLTVASGIIKVQSNSSSPAVVFLSPSAFLGV